MDVVRLYCDSDPRFPHHHRDPVQPENLTDLIATVRRTQADLGIGLDEIARLGGRPTFYRPVIPCPRRR